MYGSLSHESDRKHYKRVNGWGSIMKYILYMPLAISTLALSTNLIKELRDCYGVMISIKSYGVLP